MGCRRENSRETAGTASKKWRSGSGGGGGWGVGEKTHVRQHVKSGEVGQGAVGKELA